MSKTVSLVLGSGGARGLAHLGVIRFLEERGDDIRSISGCSIGALVGGVYALDELKAFEEWVCAIRRRDIVALLDISWGGKGFFKGDKIVDQLKEFVGDTSIEDLGVAYTAVAADIRKAREVWISSGPLFDAIRASISLPLFFTPFSYNGVDLFDGGLLNPVPVAPTVKDTTDLTVAVNLGGRPERHRRPEDDRESANRDAPDGLHERIAAFIEDLRNGLPGISPTEMRMYEIAQSSFDAMQGTVARHQLAAYRPDVEIVIPRDACGMLEFDRAEELIDRGYRAALDAMPDA